MCWKCPQHGKHYLPPHTLDAVSWQTYVGSLVFFFFFLMLRMTCTFKKGPNQMLTFGSYSVAFQLQHCEKCVIFLELTVLIIYILFKYQKASMNG